MTIGRSASAALAALLVSGASAVSAQTGGVQDETARETVTGIGGFFFRSEDPAALAAWYRETFGIDTVPQSYDVKPWRQEEGPTVFAPFTADTSYFGDPDNMWMINFRVRDLDAMVAQLRAAEIDVEVDLQAYPNGRFARLTDPEGNPVQLWEPATPTGE